MHLSSMAEPLEIDIVTLKYQINQDMFNQEKSKKGVTAINGNLILNQAAVQNGKFPIYSTITINQPKKTLKH